MLIEICQSDETDTWHGHRIKLYVTKVEFQGKRVDGLRIDYPGAQPKPQPAPELTEDEILF